MNRRALFVDDDPCVLQTHQKCFGKKCDVTTFLDPEEALEAIRTQPTYAVVVADMRMPGMSGTALLARTRELSPGTVGIILTGSQEQQAAADAINRGSAFRFITKPYSLQALVVAVEDALAQHDLLTSEREVFEKTVAGSVKMLTDVLSLAEPQAFAVGQKLRDLVRAFINATPVFDAWSLEVAALLSQVGFVTIPHSIIEKRARRLALAEEEAEMILRVPQVGHDLINHIPRLERAAKIVLHQQKNYDGTGFPDDGLAGEAIPYGARLFRILLELIDGESRCVTKGENLHRMRERPEHFDPKIVDAVEANLKVKIGGPRVAYFENVGAPDKPPSQNRQIHLSELQIGDRLSSDISTMDNLIVVAAGSEINSLTMTRIRNFKTIHRLREKILIEA